MTLGAGAPAGSTVGTDLTQAGRVIVTVNLGSALTSAAALELVRIQAAVPSSAAALYTQKTVLDLKDVSINQGALAVRADDGLLVNAYVGDADASKGYDALDIQRLQRVVARLDSGFATYPQLDPAILGDTTGDGSLNSLDAQRLQQKVAGLPQPTIPPLPTPPPSLQGFASADSVFHLGAAMTEAKAQAAVPTAVDRIAALQSLRPGTIKVDAPRVGSVVGSDLA